MLAITVLNLILFVLFILCYGYQIVYIPVSWFGDKIKKEEKNKNQISKIYDYAVLICARNESNVITDLIESIKMQTYPGEHISIFVMADNCDDDTFEKAVSAGAKAYVRNNRKQIGKGYALDALLKEIKKDYPSGFDGYFVFDADNILAEDFIENMNRTFAEGYDIVTCYRNSKNYGSNWISAGYALWFIKDSRFLNLPRSILNTSCAVSGTGFLFSREVEDSMNGWAYHLLVEDIEFSIDQIIKGRKITYCPEAVIFDEQPVDFTTSWNQRMRWARGYLQILAHYGKRMLKGSFKSFGCLDMTLNILPAFILTGLSILGNVILGIRYAFTEGTFLSVLYLLLFALFNVYLTVFILGLITTITEWKRIHTSTCKKIGYLFTFPLFMITYVPIAIVSLF